MRFACWITKARTKHTRSLFNTYCFFSGGSNGYANAPQWYVYTPSLVLFSFSLGFSNLHFNLYKVIPPVMMLQPIIFVCPVSSFMCSHLSLRTVLSICMCLAIVVTCSHSLHLSLYPSVPKLAPNPYRLYPLIHIHQSLYSHIPQVFFIFQYEIYFASFVLNLSLIIITLPVRYLTHTFHIPPLSV